MKKVFALFLVLLISQVIFAYNGDVNGDGTVTSADVTAIYNFILNGDETALINGDVNGDGEITSADVTVIYNILLGTPTDVTVFVVNGVTFNMVSVSGGTFTMGATGEQGDDAFSNEYPTHEVTLSTFSIGQTEVTQELWLAVMGINPSYFNGIGNPDYGSSHSADYGIDLQRPVEFVSWDDCQLFIAALNQMTGKNFRLPTEAEWEFAARGGNKSQGYKYAGSNTIGDVAWYADNALFVDDSSPDYGTHTVTTKQPNALGLYDMSGNVYEWCLDWYSTYYSESPSTNPTGPESGSKRVTRGGSWHTVARGCRVSYRSKDTPDKRRNYFGLRLAL